MLLYLKSDRKDGKRRKEYLLPSIKLPGSGLPLKMAAACHRGGFEEKKIKERKKRRGEERAQLNNNTSGNFSEGRLE